MVEETGSRRGDRGDVRGVGRDDNGGARRSKEVWEPERQQGLEVKGP